MEQALTILHPCVAQSINNQQITYMGYTVLLLTARPASETTVRAGRQHTHRDAVWVVSLWGG